jgi:hypothetical protein
VTWQGKSASARPELQAEQPLCQTIVSEIERISPLPHQHLALERDACARRRLQMAAMLP